MRMTYAYAEDHTLIFKLLSSSLKSTRRWNPCTLANLMMAPLMCEIRAVESECNACIPDSSIAWSRMRGLDLVFWMIATSL